MFPTRQYVQNVSIRSELVARKTCNFYTRITDDISIFRDKKKPTRVTIAREIEKHKKYHYNRQLFLWMTVLSTCRTRIANDKLVRAFEDRTFHVFFETVCTCKRDSLENKTESSEFLSRGIPSKRRYYKT